VASLVERFRVFARSDRFQKLWRYGSVSVITTIVTNTLLFVFYDVLVIGSAAECNVLACVITTVPAYWLNRTWTWRRSGKSDLWREVVPFWSIALFTLALSTVAVAAVAHNSGHISHSKLVKALLIDAANVVTYGSIWLLKFFLYNRYLFTGKERTALATEAAASDEVPTDDVATPREAVGVGVTRAS
jgi:putative flippase GtrA